MLLLCTGAGDLQKNEAHGHSREQKMPWQEATQRGWHVTPKPTVAVQFKPFPGHTVKWCWSTTRTKASGTHRHDHSLLTTLCYCSALSMTENLVMDSVGFSQRDQKAEGTKMTWKELETGFRNLGITFKEETVQIRKSLGVLWRPWILWLWSHVGARGARQGHGTRVEGDCPLTVSGASSFLPDVPERRVKSLLFPRSNFPQFL